MFDQFREQIERGCDAGMTLKEIYDTLPEGYIYQSLYSYVKVHKIRENSWKRVVDARRTCENCEYFQKFLNRMGRENKIENRLCTLSWRIIANSVRHCPTWCEYEGKHEELKRVDGTEDR